MRLGSASAPQVIKCPDHATRAQVHATIAAVAQLIERVSRPKPFVVEVTKGINNDFLYRRRDVVWIPRHRPQRNVAGSFDHESHDFPSADGQDRPDVRSWRKRNRGPLRGRLPLTRKGCRKG